MDVRFYPAAAGSSLPGDPSNLDFAQCLGYYNYNKVIIPACINSSCCCQGWFPESRSLGSVGAGRLGAGGCSKAHGGGVRPRGSAGPRDVRPRKVGGGECPGGRSRAASLLLPLAAAGLAPGVPPARPQLAAALARRWGVSAELEAQTDPPVTWGCESPSPAGREQKAAFPGAQPSAARAATRRTFARAGAAAAPPAGRAESSRGARASLRGRGRDASPLLCSVGRFRPVCN